MYQKNRNVFQNGKVFITFIIVFVCSILLQAAEHKNGAAHGNAYGHIKQELAGYFKQLADARLYNGTVLIAKEGKILLKKGYGMADWESETPNNPETVFAIASMGKAFTAMSIMILEERGLLSVNDTISVHIPEFPDGDLVTIHQLLTHTSGMYEFFNDPYCPVWDVIDQYHTPWEVLSYIMGQPFEFEPGTQWAYCNSGFEVLGVIIERVSGMTYRDFLKANIFEPLDMKRTSYDPFGTEFANKKATPYDVVDPPTFTVFLHPTIAYSAGGVFSNVKDMYKWDQALYTDKLVSYETMERIFTPDLGNYGYAWWIDSLEINGQPHRQFWHWGSYVGYHSLISRLVDDKVTIILLQNTNAPGDVFDDQEIIRDAVLNIIFGQSSAAKEISALTSSPGKHDRSRYPKLFINHSRGREK
jgi:CubicO group peptidase (beta-lactamase class C family)